MKPIYFFIAAFIVALPAMILITNGVWYVLTLQTFLPEGQVGHVNEARGLVCWLSFMGGVGLTMIGVSK